MNLDELMGFTRWYETEITAKRIHKRYNTLVGVLNQNAQGGGPRRPFEDELQSLREGLDSVDVHRLSIDQLAFLGKLEIEELVGEKGVANLEAEISRTPLDIASTANRLGAMAARVGAATEKSNAIKAAVGEFAPEVKPDSGDVLIRVHFHNDADIRNVVDLRRWSDDWYDIGRGLAMAEGMAPEDVRVSGAKNGSIVIELAVVAVLATTVAHVIREVLKVTARVLDIMKQLQEIRALKLANDKVEKLLSEAVDQERKSGIEKITDAVAEEVNKRRKLNGEDRKALELAIKKIVAFIEKGGDLDCYVPESIAQDEGFPELQSLRSAVKEIRALEAEQKLIEHRPAP